MTHRRAETNGDDAALSTFQGWPDRPGLHLAVGAGMPEATVVVGTPAMDAVGDRKVTLVWPVLTGQIVVQRLGHDLSPEVTAIWETGGDGRLDAAQAAGFGTGTGPGVFMVGGVNTPRMAEAALALARMGHAVLAEVPGATMKQGLVGLLYEADASGLGNGAPAALAGCLRSAIYRRSWEGGPSYGLLTVDAMGAEADEVRQCILASDIDAVSAIAGRQTTARFCMALAGIG